MGLYIQTYTSQRRNYRKHYSKKKLDRLGFSPSSDGVAKVLNTTLALDFIVSSDNTATTFISYSFDVDYYLFTYLDKVGATKTLTGNINALPNSLFTISNLPFSAIVPLKEDNVIKEKGTNLKRMLKLLGLEYGSLLTTLNNGDIDNAYLTYAVPLNTTNQPSLKLLYHIFSTIVLDADGLDISFGNISWKYLFNVSKATITGSIGTVGTYASELVTGTPTTTGLIVSSPMSLKLKYQVTATTVEILTISDYSLSITVGSQTNNYDLTTVPDSNNGGSYNNRFLIPLDYLQSLRYKEFIVVHEESLVMVAFSVTSAKVAWYQSGWFSFLIYVAAIALQVATGVPVISAVVSTLTSVVISEVTTYVGNSLGLSDWMVSLLTVASSVTSGNYTKLLDDPHMYYKMLDLGSKLTNVYTQYKMEELANDKKSFDIDLAEYQKKLAALQEEWTNTTGVGYYPKMDIDLDYANKPLPNSGSARQMVYNMVGSKFDEIPRLYNISDVYKQKTSIHSGI